MKKSFVITLILLVMITLTCGFASAASPDVEQAVSKALDYITAHQQSDGGFAEPGQTVGSASPSWFSITAITSAGYNPLDWKVGSNTSLKFWDTPAPGAGGTGELGKMCTLLAMYGEDPRNMHGHNYVEELKAKVREDGRGGDYVYTTYWTIFGLVAAGEDASKSVAWLKTQQLDDGSFNSYGKGQGDVGDSDNTAASIMALIAGGVSPSDPVIQKALQFLRDVQEPTGGFNYGYYSSSNLASTVWVIQAFCAAGVDPATVINNGNSPVDYVLSLQQADGSFKYTEFVVDSPVGMTARAVPALMGKPYPVLPNQKAYDVKSSKYSGITSSSTTSGAAPEAKYYDVNVTTSGVWTPVTVTDDFGYSVTVDKEPVRIVSLAPTNTEILYALGLGDRIVGVTEYCNYPEDALTKPTIGGYTTVNVERVVAQKPDLVFAYYGNGIDTVDHLKQLGIKVITLNSDSINGTFKDIEMVGKTTGKVAEAKALTDDMRSKMDAIEKKLQGITSRPTTFHCVWADPLWVSGGNTFEDELIKMAGGENCFADVDGWGIVTLERLLTTDPDIIIVDSGVGMGDDGFDGVKRSLYADKRTAQLKAVKNNQVYVVSADLMDRGGPRITETLDVLATIYHPKEMGKTYSDGASGVSSPGFAPALVLGALGALAALYVARRR